MPPTKRPKQRPSGAQNRKRKKERQQRDEMARRDAGDWMAAPAYRGTSYQWDPNAPNFELPIYGVGPPQFIDGVLAAVTALEQGMFFLPTLLADGMLRDDSIMSGLDVRVSSLLGAELDISPSDESEQAAKAQAKLEREFADMFPTPELDTLHGYGLLLSVGVAQRLTLQTRKGYTPTIKAWNMRNFYYDWLSRRFMVTTENRGTLAIEPDDPEWIVWQPYGPHGWVRRAKLRALAYPWLIRKCTRDWWARYDEVSGQPIRAGIIPGDRKPADERRFLGELSNVGSEIVMRLPQGGEGKNFDIKLIESLADGWEKFEKLLAFCDKSIQVVFLGQTQSTEGQSGLGAQDKAGESTLVRILRGDCRLGKALRDQSVRQWAYENFGSDELAPFLSWVVDPPEDLEKRAKAFLDMSRGVAQLALVPNVMRHVDERALLEQYQTPVRAVEDVAPEEPNVPATPATPEGTDDKEPADEAAP